MNELLLLKGNPSRRRSKKRRSAAQRAATKRMLAANRSRFSHNPSRKRRKSRRSTSVAVAAPARRRRSSRVSRVTRRSARRRSFSGGSNIMSILKNGAIMGGGAVVADVGMGLVQKFAPTLGVGSRVNADGSMNYTYYAAKLGLIWAMGKYGTRVTRHAPMLAAGATAQIAYEIIKGFMPTDGSIPLGYFNPGRIVNGGGLGRIMRSSSGIPANQGMGKIVGLPQSNNSGAAAALTMRNAGMSGFARR